MNRLTTVLVLVCIAMFWAIQTPIASADEWNEKTVENFSGPVEIPGMVLKAGTYVFKLLDSATDRDIVQISNADGTHLYATILAIPDYRLKPTSKPVLRFEERAADAPEAIRAWFYPGRLFGEEFVYPREKAREIAKRTKQPVLSMASEMASNIKMPAKSAKDANVLALKKTPVKAINPAGEEVEMDPLILRHP